METATSKLKLAVLLLIVALMAPSLIATEAYSVESIPKPSVPEFTLQIVDYGVQIAIENQVIIPNGHDTADIFYNIRIKSHDSENWVNTTVPDLSQGIRGYIGEIGTSGSTVIYKDFNSINALLGLSNDSHQIDYEVEAINGYLNTTLSYAPPIGFEPNSTPVIVVNTSGWSNAQTIIIPKASMPSLSPTPTALIPAPTESPISTSTSMLTNTPTTFDGQAGTGMLLYALIALVAVVIALLVIIIVIIRRKPKLSSATGVTYN